MTVRSFGFSWIGVLVGAPLLLGLSLLAASPAGAQCTEEQSNAHGAFDYELDGLIYTAELTGSTAAGRNCTKICKTAAKACKSEVKGDLKEEASDGQALLKVAKGACKDAADKAACKTFIKANKKLEKTHHRARKTASVTACDNAGLATWCADVCGEDAPEGWLEACDDLDEDGIFGLSCPILPSYDSCCEVFDVCD